MSCKTFYAPKIAIFMAFYLLTLTCVMQGDRFFKGVGWLHDFSRSINFQSVEDVFDEGSHRITNKISFPKNINKFSTAKSIFLSSVFLSNFYFLNLKNNSLFLNSCSGKAVAYFPSSKLYLKYRKLIC